MAALLSSTRSVHAQSVQPVILDLQTAGRQSTQTLTVNNTRASAIPSSYASKDLYLTPTAPGGRARIPVILLFSLPRQSYSPASRKCFASNMWVMPNWPTAVILMSPWPSFRYMGRASFRVRGSKYVLISVVAVSLNQNRMYTLDSNKEV